MKLDLRPNGNANVRVRPRIVSNTPSQRPPQHILTRNSRSIVSVTYVFKDPYIRASMPIAKLTSCRTSDLTALCHADPDVLADWLRSDRGRLGGCVAWMLIGSAIYGASIGLWRAPLQSLFVAIKFPLLLIATTVANAFLNGMLARLLGAPITFRQSLQAILLSYAIVGVVLAALTPVSLFVWWNLPAMGTPAAGDAHAAMIVIHVVVIAFAGIVANLRLFALLRKVCGDGACARRVLAAWLAGNMFLGCQLSYNLRPFFGTPDLEVAFLRQDPFNGSFYEALYYLVLRLLT